MPDPVLPPRTALPQRPAHDGDWPAQAAEAIVGSVEKVRDATTGKAITVARAVVYGLFAVIVGIAVSVLAAIMGVRILVNYLPDDLVGEQHVWVAHLLIGLVFCVVGAVLWVRRQPDRAS